MSQQTQQPYLHRQRSTRFSTSQLQHPGTKPAKFAHCLTTQSSREQEMQLRAETRRQPRYASNTLESLHYLSLKPSCEMIVTAGLPPRRDGSTRKNTAGVASVRRNDSAHQGVNHTRSIRRCSPSKAGGNSNSSEPSMPCMQVGNDPVVRWSDMLQPELPVLHFLLAENYGFRFSTSWTGPLLPVSHPVLLVSQPLPVSRSLPRCGPRLLVLR